MKKCCIFLILLVFTKISVAQQLKINGSNQYRLLTWQDFSGNPDKQSEHAANTAWTINYSYTGLDFNGDSAKLKGLLIVLTLDAAQSWKKAGRETSDLLKHEQGHFDVGVLCLKALVEQMTNSSFDRRHAGPKAQDMFSKILTTYTEMNRQYDQETNHSKIKEVQEKWNLFFAKELNR